MLSKQPIVNAFLHWHLPRFMRCHLGRIASTSLSLDLVAPRSGLGRYWRLASSAGRLTQHCVSSKASPRHHFAAPRRRAGHM